MIGDISRTTTNNQDYILTKKLKVHSIALGCARNQVDSETMAYLIKKEGWNFEQDINKADVIIINTCAFIEDAKKESIDNILEALSIKSQTGSMVVVCGCFAQRYAKQVEKDFLDVDLFIGVEQYPKIVELIKERYQRIQSETDIIAGRIYTRRCPSLYEKKLEKINTLSKKSAYVKIADGCRHRCSFCAIPLIRGSLKSVPEQYIVDEIDSLVSGGVVEINLIAQDLAAYGMDLKRGENLYKLLDKLSRFENIWIRLLYYYPEYINKDLISCFKNYPNIVKYLDIPVQHISDRVLERMNRSINSSKLIETLDYLKSEIKDISLRTSLLVGFPGETDDDVKQLVDFVSKGYFDNLGCFSYSREENTPAYNYTDQIEEDKKTERVKMVMETQKRVLEKKMSKRIGSVLDVLVEGRNEPDHYEQLTYTGRAYFQAPEVDGLIYIKDSEDNKIREDGIYRVKIIQARDYDLVGVFEDTGR